MCSDVCVFPAATRIGDRGICVTLVLGLLVVLVLVLDVTVIAVAIVILYRRYVFRQLQLTIL